MTDLSDLIARLEAASDGSVAMDLDIAKTLGLGLKRPEENIPQPYTRSLDVALTLVPDKHWFSITQFGPPAGRKNTAFMAQCITLTDYGIKKSWGSKNNSPALALCIAALRARNAP